MSSLLQPVISLVNSVGHSVASGVASVLSLNHLVASNVVNIFSLVLSWAREAVLVLLTALRIILEDLFVFLREIFDSFFVACDTIASFFDALCSFVLGFFCGCKDLVVYSVGGVTSTLWQCQNLLRSLWLSTGDFFHLLGSSIVLLITLVPGTLYALAIASAGLCRTLASSFRRASDKVVGAVTAAPLEMTVGLVAGIIIVYSTFRLASKLVRDHRLTPALVLQVLLRSALFLYLNFIRGVITAFCVVFFCVTTTLTHLHVPRFHHAGDSDAEGDSDGGEDAAADAMAAAADASDNEENERRTEKWRNYNLLLQRREQKLKNRLNKKAVDDETEEEEDANVEEMLFEQVEREREDKLCVICQDKEKCIMILPCRHLCICETCQEPLQTHGNNICPICRKNVRQTIKAYL